jgi:hypothetical protein
MQTHLSVLEQSALRYHSHPAFKVPAPASTSESPTWISITYQQFKEDVELVARHWARVLKRDGIEQRSIIGLWCVCKLFYLTLVPDNELGLEAFHTQMRCISMVYPGQDISHNSSACASLIPTSFSNYYTSLKPVHSFLPSLLPEKVLFRYIVLPHYPTS